MFADICSKQTWIRWSLLWTCFSAFISVTLDTDFTANTGKTNSDLNDHIWIRGDSMAIVYSSRALLNISSQLAKPTVCGLVYQKLKHLAIFKLGRGCRAGKNNQRNIKVLNSYWPLGDSHSRGVCRSNIIDISLLTDGCKQRNITVKCSAFDSTSLVKSCSLNKGGVNADNLTYIKGSPKPEPEPHQRTRGVDSSNLISIAFNNSPPLEAMLLNARSLCSNEKSGKKQLLIHDYIIDLQLDFLAITETWIKPNTPGSALASVTPAGYTLEHVPRPSGRNGGGVGLIYRDTFQAKRITTPMFSSFEHMVTSLKYRSKTFIIIVVYRPPTYKNAGVSFTTFLTEFPQLLEDVLLSSDHLIITGDFNVHMDNHDVANTKHFNSLIDGLGLVQSVNDTTHRHGHTLDLILTRPDQTPSSVMVSDVDSDMFDHYSVRFAIPTMKPPLPKRAFQYRSIKTIDLDAFASDIETSRLFGLETDDVNVLANTYNCVLRELLDKHAPLKDKTITVHPVAPWYTDEVKKAKSEKRKAERKWRKTGLEIHRQIYQASRDEHSAIIAKSKVEYFKERIDSSSNSQSALFSCVKELLNENKPSKLPSCDSTQELANRIASFFSEKITKIRAYLEEIQHKFGVKLAPEESLVSEELQLKSLDPVTEDEIQKLIMTSATKSCILDPIPTFLLKKCLNVLLPIITKLINLSFKSSKVPDCFKIAAIIPLLKKVFLDPEIFNNLRPVSTLPFISKTLEKAAGNRFGFHRVQNHLKEKNQSAYSKGHSTETALIRIQNDLLVSLDSKKCVYLVLLDMSAAFDTVDHAVLLTRLSDRYGIKDGALRWVESYLTGRKQFVSVGSSRSEEHQLHCNVPQGSILGPSLFGDYNAPVAGIFRRHGVEFHLYADDTQVYVSFPAGCESEARLKLENCLEEVRLWMAANYLKLNDSKTDFIIIGSPHSLKRIQTTHITIGDEIITPSECVRNIGASIDKNLKMDRQVNLTCKSAWFSMYKLGKISRYLSESQLKTVVHSFIVSKLDQNNSLLVGAPKYLTRKLQSVQNCAAKLVCRINRYDRVEPPLKDLHWLPIEQRIQFKILLLCYKSLNDIGPDYLRELLIPYTPARPLRSSSAKLLLEPKSSTKTYGDRAFSIVGPRLWNMLPTHIKEQSTVVSFKKSLKTHLFKVAFD